jgi:hypothetical protein
MDQRDFPWRPLGTLLVEEGLVAPTDLERALEEQRQTGGLLGQILVARSVLTGGELTRALAKQHGVELRSAHGAAAEVTASAARVEPRVGHDHWRPLGKVLVQQGFLTDAVLRQGLAEQRESPGRRLGEVLVEGGYLSGLALAAALAEQHGVDLGTEDVLEIEVEALVAPAAAGEPTYEVLAVGYEPADARRSPLYVSPNFLEAADFACDYVDREQPVALEIHRKEPAASETVWTYSQERAEEASSSGKSLVETFGFDPTRWDAKL